MAIYIEIKRWSSQVCPQIRRGLRARLEKGSVLELTVTTPRQMLEIETEDSFYWTRTIAITEVAEGIQLCWNCIPGVSFYRVQYADALSQQTTWNTFPEIIDGTGLDRVSYTDTTAGSETIRFYRITKHNP